MAKQEKLLKLEKREKQLYAASTTLGKVGTWMYIAGIAVIGLGWILSGVSDRTNKKIEKLRKEVSYGH